MAGKFRAGTLPQVIPVFPLAGALLLPHTRLPLNIFEPRYLAMLDDALRTPERLIGMVQPLPSYERPGQAMAQVSGHDSTGKPPRLHHIGCVGRLIAFVETDEGPYRITLGGVSRFRLVEQQQGFAPYLRWQVSWQGFEQDLSSDSIDAGFDRAAFLDLLERYFANAQLRPDWASLRQADTELLINSLAMLCPFDPEEKQALLEAPTLTNRRETLVTLMEFALRGGDEEGLLQ